MNVHSRYMQQMTQAKIPAKDPMYAAPLPTARLDARSAEILDRVRSTFAQKGFDGASMKDLAEAAGMSAGNFYRYFPGKSAIVEALIARQLEQVRSEFARVLEAEDPRGALRDMVREKLLETDCDEGAFWAEIEAAASRRAELAAMKDRMTDEVLRSLTAIFGRLAGVPAPEAQTRFGAHARLIVLLVQGVMMRPRNAASACGPEEPDRALAALVVETIDNILARIDARPPPGG